MESFKGFVVYPTYTVVEDNNSKRSFVQLYGRLEDGKSFVTINERKAYFYIKQSDLKKAEKLIPVESEDTRMKNFDEEPVIKLLFDSPKDVPEARKILQSEDIICYEADILFAYRFMIDNSIKGSIKIKGKSFSSEEYYSLHNKRYYTDFVFLNPEVKGMQQQENDSYNPNLKVLSFDIETSMDAKNLLSIAISTNDNKINKVLMNKKGIINNADSFDSPETLIKEFFSIIREYDPDIITGWNVVDFDLNIIREFSRQYNIPFNIGRDDSNAYLKLSDSFFQDSVAKVNGRVILDGISLLKTNFVKLPDYKLETVAQHYLGEGKILKGEERHSEIQQLYIEDPSMLAKYNIKDAKLVLDILEKSQVLELTIARTKLTRMQLDRVKASIASLDSLYLEKLKEKNIVAPTAHSGSREERLTGGYVRSSIPGIYDNILVFDFKSLYPSIIRTFNIDPYSFIPKEKIDSINDKNDKNNKNNKNDMIIAPNGAHFRNEEGLLPSIIESLWDQRDKAKKEKNDLKSYAIKILMNSMFGVLGNPNCRFFSLEMGNAITHFGQHLIKLTADEVEKKGKSVIYGDTDSIFINIKEKDYKKACKKGEELSSWINDFFTKYITDNYNRESRMEIEFEKVYKKFFMPKIRGSEKGAKKRYAGILVKDGKDMLDFVGLESVRSDWTRLAKNFQKELFTIIFDENDPGEFIKNYVKKLRNGKFDDNLAYRKQIRKPVSEYVKTTPPHIQAARKIGREEVGIIDYIMTVDGPEEKDNVEHDIDYEHYIEKQLKPIADNVLVFFDQTFEDMIKNHKQNSLLDY